MTKLFSIKHKVTEQDITEFNAWIKSKEVTPKLRKEFKSDQEYEDFMMKEQDKHFSEIKSEEEFRKYAHTVMKQAHGEDYSEETTNKVVDDLIKDNPNADWGELIGRLTSGFGTKSFSYSIDKKEAIDKANKEINDLNKKINDPKLKEIDETGEIVNYLKDKVKKYKEFINIVPKFEIGDHIEFNPQGGMFKIQNTGTILGFEPSIACIYVKLDPGVGSFTHHSVHDLKSIKKLNDKKFSLPISKDPSIVLRDNDPTQQTQSNIGSMKPKVDDLTLDWNVTKPFNLSVEPWLVVNCISDCADGFYKGNLVKDSFEYGDRKVMFDIAVANAEPIEVFVLIKNKKAYIFKSVQLVKAEKTYSEGACPESGCIQQKENGKWGVISNKTGKYWGQTDDKPLGTDYESEDTAKSALAAYHANKHFSEKSFSTFDVEMGNWDGAPGSDVTLDNLIGSVAFSVTYTHLFHWKTQNYAAHKAFEDYYEDMPDLIDKLAESAMSEFSELKFKNIIIPGECPIEYLERLKSLCSLVELSPALKECKNAELYASQISNIQEVIASALYKLRRLSMGHKLIEMKSPVRSIVSSEVNLNDILDQNL